MSQPQPLFSLIYTSVRPTQIGPVIAEWVSKSKLKNLEVVLTVDANDQPSADMAKAIADRFTVPYRWFVQLDAPFNCVKGWNLAAEKSVGKVLVQVTDDFSPPEGWDEALLALKPNDWIEDDWAVHVDDGYVKTLMTLAIITRKRYERFAYLFYPDYESLFCDTELTEVAYREKKVINASHLLFEHQHPDCHKRERDKVDAVHASQERWTRGEMLFNYRKSHGFPVDVGSMAGKTESAVEELKFCCYIQATRDDFCLREVCQRMREEGVNDFFFSVPDEYWSGRPTPQEEIDQVIACAKWLTESGVNAFVNVHRVRTYRFPGDSRIRVETRVRNDALAWIRKAGFEHILIVDGDELWKRGTLAYVTDIVKTQRPAAISTYMIPAVGLPGYPIDGATDVAVVYIGGKMPFKECRTPLGDQFRIHMPFVIHFTGCRRTMEDIILKHKQSGHYDDPDYDFEGWLTNVLPNIKPGFKDVHMYKKYQIWPVIRNWWATEIEEIPESLWPYLAIQTATSSSSATPP